MYKVFMELLQLGIIGYLLAIMIAAKHYIVDEIRDTPKVFWINVGIFMATALIVKYIF